MAGILGASFAIFSLLFVLLTLAFVYSTRYKKVGPNEVLVISGRRRHITHPITGQEETVGFRIVKGGGTFIWPVVERVDDLSLEIMTIDVVTPKVYTVQGVPVTVDGVAQVKVRGDDVSIFTAAEQFLSKTEKEIQQVALQTLEGHLRAILGTMSVEEIYKDRDAFAQQVQEVAAGDLANMGLGIISFTIRDIRDDEGYLDALGKARTAEVKRDATIGEALAARDAKIRSAEAEQEGEEARFIAQTNIAEAEKNFQVQKAKYDADVNRQTAEAELAYTLQQAITNQEVKAQEVQIEVVDKQKRIEVQQQEALRREKELEATVRKPAEAEQYRIETLARAKRFQTETEAEGQAAAVRRVGEGEAEANRARGLAQAEVAQAQGLAQAEVIRQQGLAEAEAKAKKAEAWAMYNQAAIIEQLLASLPELAGAIAQPLSKTERIVVIGGDGAGGAGSSRITRDVTEIIAQVPAAVEALTGIDIIGTIQDLPALRRAAGDGSARKEAPARVDIEADEESQ
ncbi:MAG: flotillin family protein [Anaerolineae bacterium]